MGLLLAHVLLACLAWQAAGEWSSVWAGVPPLPAASCAPPTAEPPMLPPCAPSPALLPRRRLCAAAIRGAARVRPGAVRAGFPPAQPQQRSRRGAAGRRSCSRRPLPQCHPHLKHHAPLQASGLGLTAPVCSCRRSRCCLAGASHQPLFAAAATRCKCLALAAPPPACSSMVFDPLVTAGAENTYQYGAPERACCLPSAGLPAAAPLPACLQAAPAAHACCTAAAALPPAPACSQLQQLGVRRRFC